jgi:surface polysaccharide O-acyltransferase-like enzyme
MAVLVIGNHAGSYQYFIDISPVFDYVRRLAVPVFVILSSYFTPAVIDYFSSEWRILPRLKRLYKPAVIWGLTYFAVCYAIRGSTLWPKVGGYFQPYDVSIQNVLLQLFFGSVLSPALYYLIDLIWLTALFYVVCVILFRGRCQTMLLILIALFGLSFQYSGLNWLLFSHCDYRIKFTLGRFCEFLPFFSLGFLLKKHRCFGDNTASIALAGGLLTLGYLLWSWHQPGGFGYNGIGILMGATCLFVLFSKLRLDGRTVYARIIKELSAVTLGVYCIHMLIIPLCSLLFQHYGFDSHRSIPLLFTAIVLLSFLTCLLMRTALGAHSKGVVT